MYAISYAGVDIAVGVAVDTVRNTWRDVAEQFAVTQGSILFDGETIAAAFQLVPVAATISTTLDETHMEAGAEKLYP